MEGIDWDLLSSYAGLLSLATFSIYAGSFGSLPVHQNRLYADLVTQLHYRNRDEVKEKRI